MKKETMRTYYEKVCKKTGKTPVDLQKLDKEVKEMMNKPNFWPKFNQIAKKFIKQ